MDVSAVFMGFLRSVFADFLRNSEIIVYTKINMP